jgi:hypothetical protein
MTASDSDDLKARIAQVRRELKEFDRPRREKLVRLGRVKPRTAAEWEIFASDLLNPPPPAPRQQRKGPRRNTKRAVITDVGMDPADVEGSLPAGP